MKFVFFIFFVLLIASLLAWLWLRLERYICKVIGVDKASSLVIILRMIFIALPTVVSANAYLTLNS
jgi:glucan phosphoethanolaminetransferase (alkaline phosphatase superfamily)